MDWWISRTVLVGAPEDVDLVSQRISRHPEFSIEVVGSVQINGHMMLRRFRRPGEEQFSSENMSRIGVDEADAVLQTIGEADASRVIITDMPSGLQERTDFLGELIASGVHLDLVSGETDALCATASLQHLEGLNSDHSATPDEQGGSDD